MKNITRVSIGTIVLSVLSVLTIAGCVSSGEVSVLTGAELNRAPEEQLVWVGTGTSYRYEENGWVRTPEQDYDYEQGTLTETVLLLEVSDDGEERPFVRVREHARIFSPAER